MVAPKDVIPHGDGAPLKAVQEATGENLVRWASSHGARFDRRLSQQLADVVTTIAPDFPTCSLALLARYSLWTFLLDDALDDVTADPSAIAEVAGRLTALVRTTATIGAPPQMLDAMLAELIAELRSVGTPSLLTHFVEALCDAIDAGIQHTVRAQQIRQGHATAPTVLEYLAVAGRHINYCSFAYLLLMLTRTKPTTAAESRIGRALVAASRAIRIANDLASVDRDRAAGRLNILLLPHADAAGVAAFGRQIDHYVRLHDHLLRDAAEVGVLRRSLHVAVAVYRMTDLR